MWLTGAPDDRVTVTAVAELKRLAGSSGTAWTTGDLAVWLQRLGLLRSGVGLRLAEPHRLSLEGRHVEAALWWRQARSPFEEAMELAATGDPSERVRCVEIFDDFGATAVADRERLSLRSDGVAGIPQRPRRGGRADPVAL